VSRWSSERATAWLAPGGAALAVHAPGWRGPRLRAERAIARMQATRFPGWREAVQALQDDLGREPLRARGLDVVLSDHWVRYVALPWREGLNGAAEWAAYAAHAFGTTYGDVAGRWRVRVAAGLPGDARLAAAIDDELPAALAALAGEAGLPLGRIEPHFCRAFDRFRRVLPGAGAWFVTLEPGRLCAGRVAGGGCFEVVRARSGEHPADTLETVLRETALAAGDDAAAATVFVVAQDAPPVSGRSVAMRPIGRPAGSPAAAWALGMV